MSVGRFGGILSLEALGGRDGSRRVSWRISNNTEAKCQGPYSKVFVKDILYIAISGYPSLGN